MNKIILSVLIILLLGAVRACIMILSRRYSPRPVPAAETKETSSSNALGPFSRPQAVPLFQATTLQEKESVRYLPEDGADPNEPGPGQLTPLMAAAYNGDTETAALLLAKGANPHIGDARGDTALIYAAGKGHKDLVQLLLDSGANPNQAGNHLMTALILAVNNGHAEIVSRLLQANASPNQAAEKGATPLTTAVQQKNIPMIQQLLDAGAEVKLFCKDKMGNIKPRHLTLQEYKELRSNFIQTLDEKPDSILAQERALFKKFETSPVFKNICGEEQLVLVL